MGALSELLSSLPEEERFILTMHYIRSMSAKEIGEALGVPNARFKALSRVGNLVYFPR